MCLQFHLLYPFLYFLNFVYVHDGVLLKGVEPWLRFVGPTSATNELFIITSHFDKISKVASSFAVSHVAKKTSWQKIFAKKMMGSYQNYESTSLTTNYYKIQIVGLSLFITFHWALSPFLTCHWALSLFIT